MNGYIFYDKVKALYLIYATNEWTSDKRRATHFTAETVALDSGKLLNYKGNRYATCFHEL